MLSEKFILKSGLPINASVHFGMNSSTAYYARQNKTII